MTAKQLQQQAIIIDAVCPLISSDGQHLDLYRAGGCTVVGPTAGGFEGTARTVVGMGRWMRLIEERDDLIMVRRAEDVIRAKRENKLGIFMHFQGTDPIEGDLDLIDTYKALGVGVIQITYNVKCRVGDGCEERTDSGLSRFGLELIKRMNRAKVIVDCSHTGHRTTMDAIEASSAPVIVSHANAYAVHPSSRNLKDDQIKAIAASGGVIGLVTFPAFVSKEKKPTLDAFIDHAAYYADLVGVDHVGLGMDYFPGQSDFVDDHEAKIRYDRAVAAGIWGASYPEPPYNYPAEIETPNKLLRLTERMLERGFSPDDVRKVLGENWLRVYRAVWG